VITASAKTKWLMVDPAAASFEGEFSSVTTSYAGPVTSVVGPKTDLHARNPTCGRLILRPYSIGAAHC